MSLHDESVKRYPLEWPIGWKRTPAPKRVDGTFSTKKTANGWLTVTIATGRLEAMSTRVEQLEEQRALGLR